MMLSGLLYLALENRFRVAGLQSGRILPLFKGGRERISYLLKDSIGLPLSDMISMGSGDSGFIRIDIWNAKQNVKCGDLTLASLLASSEEKVA